MLTDILIIVVSFLMSMIWIAKFQSLQEKYSEWIDRSFGNYAWFSIAKYLPVFLLFQKIELFERLVNITNSL